MVSSWHRSIPLDGPTGMDGAVREVLAGIVSRAPDPVLPTVPRDDVRREAAARFVAMVERWQP